MTQTQTHRPNRRPPIRTHMPNLTTKREPYREEQLPRVLLLADFIGTMDERTTYAQLRAALRGSDIDQGGFPAWYHAMDDFLPVTRRAAAVLLLSVVQQ